MFNGFKTKLEKKTKASIHTQKSLRYRELFLQTGTQIYKLRKVLLIKQFQLFCRFADSANEISKFVGRAIPL